MISMVKGEGGGRRGERRVCCVCYREKVIWGDREGYFDGLVGKDLYGG